MIEADGDTVVVMATLNGKGRGSGIEVRQEIAQVAAFRAGKVVRIVVHTERGEALEAVGLAE